MGMTQLVVTAVLVEGRRKSEVARDYGVSRRWVLTLVQRYLAEGESGLLPRSRRPRPSPTRTAEGLENEIIAIRKELVRDGQRPLPGPPRQDRFERQTHPAAQQPAPPHRTRSPARRHTRPGPR